MRMLRGFAGTMLAAAVTLAGAATAVAAPEIHAHRGGSYIDGEPAFPENTLPAFQHASAQGFVLELDVKLTADRVPVVIHDDTVDRTTACTGAVGSFTLAALAACPTDVLGSPGSGLRTAPATGPVPIPTLEAVLDHARRTGARLNIEIKNLPNDNDFDPTSAYANRIVDDIEAAIAAGLSPSQVIVQSFWPPNLDVAAARLPGVETSLLTLAQMNEGAPAFAAARDYDWVSPAWPVSPVFVAEAHALGRRVVPYTLDTPAAVSAAAAAGVDAIITDDPVMARGALGGGGPSGQAAGR